jgi:hypothetical protein
MEKASGRIFETVLGTALQGSVCLAEEGSVPETCN